MNWVGAYTYELPLVHSDRAEVGFRVVRVDRTSFVMEHQIRDTNDYERIFATGRSVMVWCHYHMGRPTLCQTRYAMPLSKWKSKCFPDWMSDSTFYHSNNFVMIEFYAMLSRLSSHLLN